MRVAVLILASNGSLIPDSFVEEVEAICSSQNSVSSTPASERTREDRDCFVIPNAPTRARDSLSSETVILRFSEGSSPTAQEVRSFGVPQDDGGATDLRDDDGNQVAPNSARAHSYASAVQSGFIAAMKNGCTHAITLDIDRGHSPFNLQSLVSISEQAPRAIITAVRKLPPGRLPLSVRLARFNADFWTASITGRWIRDVAFGYRLYPLAAVGDLASRSVGREFDLEMLVKAGWSGVPVVQILVSIPADTRPRLMAPVEFFRFGRLIFSLLAQRLILPTPLLVTMHRRGEVDRPWLTRVRVALAQAILHHCDRPPAFAAAVGLGVFFGIAPVWGFQIILGAAAAHLLRLSKRVTVAASTISSPLTIPVILYASLLTGRALHGRAIAGLPRPSEIDRAVLLQSLGEYLLGSVVLAIFAGLVAAGVTYLAAARLKSRRAVRI